MIKATWGNIELTDECASNYAEKDKTKLLGYYRMHGWLPEQLLDCGLARIIETSREKVIEWLRENTTREQWGNNSYLPDNSSWKFTDVRYIYDCNHRSILRVLNLTTEDNIDDIFFENVFEQPVFIDGAEYLVHPLKNLGYPFDGVHFTYNLNTNRFNGPDGVWLSADDFGTNFTVELAVMGPTPPKPDSPLTHVWELRDYLKLDNKKKVDEICETALSRLKEQAVIVGSVGKLNEICQKHNIGSWGDSVIDSVIDYIKLHEGFGVTPYTVDRTKPRNKYDREIIPGIYVDVYDVLEAFNPQSKAIDHAVKKLLAPGQRGVKDRVTDLKEAVSSIQREIERLGEWSTEGDNQ